MDYYFSLEELRAWARVCLIVIVFGSLFYSMYTNYVRNKYEKIARRMYINGELAAGQVWQHYRNKRYYTIQVVSNAIANGKEWPLTIVYMTAKGYAVYSRPAHEFIRKFKLVDEESNARETPTQNLLALMSYVTGRVSLPEQGSKWVREYGVPTGTFNELGHCETRLVKEKIVVDNVTNLNQPCPYVNYTDQNGSKKTITLHHFRQNFVKDVVITDRVSHCILNNENVAALDEATLRDGDRVTVKEVVDNEFIVVDYCGISAKLVMATKGFYVGAEYVINDGCLTIGKDDE
ncbi:hypothetical protein JA33_024 [Dickeya phage vB_DsoM_JA33]|uniref:Uncharacterized protein n=2 Tax=Salmondvirus JA11 TaxID=2734141 RepID=A0A386K5W1_9CAUD|nr:hypothetical protein HOU32_gp024 [Dickeya phage vB_DsoM_JA11]AXG67398.1 hypothetical protein JA33_024 [Dickeya phage vB_DsoM_JA33]AYD79829.1 hypothetical protein JA11_024 [Dickeya phage vB_DsoM_JA11]